MYWSDPRLAVVPEMTAGPVMVAVHYTVAASKEPEFLTAVQALRATRRRTGAISWELYRDAEHGERFVEIFRVPSWEEHLHQHSGRLTATDQPIEEAALAFSDPPATADHPAAALASTTDGDQPRTESAGQVMTVEVVVSSTAELPPTSRSYALASCTQSRVAALQG